MELSEVKRAIHAFARGLSESQPARLDHAESQMAELLLYLVRLSNRLGINLFEAAQKKVEADSSRQPTLVADPKLVREDSDS
jgi:NTP pyrophosphatase (non-canonical NTP hydrolase)